MQASAPVGGFPATFTVNWMSSGYGQSMKLASSVTLADLMWNNIRPSRSPPFCQWRVSVSDQHLRNQKTSIELAARRVVVTNPGSDQRSCTGFAEM
jgi:hypothetical protein